MGFDVQTGESLLDCGDLVEFWREFADSFAHPLSIKELLVRAARMTVDVLDGAAEEFDEIIEGAPLADSDVGRSEMDEERWEARVRAFRERFNC